MHLSGRYLHLMILNSVSETKLKHIAGSLLSGAKGKRSLNCKLKNKILIMQGMWKRADSSILVC